MWCKVLFVKGMIIKMATTRPFTISLLRVMYTFSWALIKLQNHNEKFRISMLRVMCTRSWALIKPEEYSLKTKRRSSRKRDKRKKSTKSKEKTKEKQNQGNHWFNDLFEYF